MHTIPLNNSIRTEPDPAGYRLGFCCKCGATAYAAADYLGIIWGMDGDPDCPHEVNPEE